MKHFITLITFLSLTIFVNAQLNMEEISYNPSPTGYYDNLVVKGSAYIQNLATDIFDVISYGSVLDFKTPNKDIYIKKLTIPNNNDRTVTVALSSTNKDITTEIGVNPLAPGETNISEMFTNIHMNGGVLSVAPSVASDTDHPVSKVNVHAMYFYQSGITHEYDVITQNLTIDNTDILVSPQGLVLMGMKVPNCPGGWAWQNVPIGGTSYSALACNN